MKKLLLTLSMAALALPASAQDIVLKGKELFGDLQARQIGPALMSGRIIDIENHPKNDRNIYIATAGGGVWKSGNGGASFSPIFDDQIQSVGVVALDPNDPDNTIWVGTGEIWTRNSVSIGDGLYRSTDAGVTWTKIPGFEKSERIAAIEINPNNSQEIYVGVLGALWSDSDVRGVYKTTDGGATWTKILYTDAKTGCADLIMDPKDPNILYASMWEFRRTAWSFSSGGANSALYKSTDGGKTWNKIHNGFPAGKLGRIAVAVAPSNTSILYAVLETEKDADKGLYRSDDGGGSWKLLNGDFGLVVRPFYFSRITIDPRNPDVVVKAGLFGSISRDGGKTFKNLGQMHADIHDITFDINNSDRMYVATDGGLYRTWDGGNTMEIVANLPLSQFYHISLDDEEPYNVYGGLQDNGSWYGPSSSPGGVENRDWNSVGFGDGFRVLRHRTKKIVYSEMQGAENIWRYDITRNQAKSIQPLQTKGLATLRFNWNTPISLSEHNADRIYAGSQFVHVSDDMGDTWRVISPDLTTNDPKKQNQEESGGLSRDNSGAENHCTIFTIAESPRDEKIIWVGTDDGQVQITRDGGKTWTNVTKNVPGLPANTWTYHIEASVHAPGTAYAVFDGHTRGDFTPYAYKTTDFGATWTSVVSPDVTAFARNIQEDYVNENLLFLGTEAGLYITIDGGKNWSKFTNNMPSVAVHFIDLHKKTGDLVMGTHGRGVIILDDISPLRQISQDVLKKEVHFFDVKPAVIRESSGFGGTSTEREYVGPNPSQEAKIVYYLKKRHTFGKMTMEIQDENGKKLTDLSPGKSKGINVVTWNFTTKQPKLAKAKTFAFGGFTSPRVKAGTYRVVTIKGKDTLVTPLVVQYDATSLLTQADRDRQYETTMKLFNMTQALAYTVYEMDALLEKGEEVAKKDKNGEKAAKPLLDELNKLKETMVVTKGDNYVGAGKPQLREKMAELYAKVAGGFQPPSAAELENLALIEEQYKKALSDLDAIKKKRMPAVEKYIKENKMGSVVLKSFDDFLIE